MDYNGLDSAIRRRSAADVQTIVIDDALRHIAEGRSTLRAVQHPLGFACLPVHRAGPAGVCVHVWPSRRRPSQLTTSPFHCHSWELLSFVLYGCVGNQLVSVRDGSTYQALEIRSDDEADEVVATGRYLDADVAEPEFWRAGQFYELPAGKFHASALLDEEDTASATVVLGLWQPGQPDIALGAPDTLTHWVGRPRYSQADTALIAQRLVARVTGARAMAAATG